MKNRLPIEFVIVFALAARDGHVVAAVITYAQARTVRMKAGHEAALPLYRALVDENPNDITAATRIAICKETPSRQDAACPNNPDRIRKLHRLLDESNYNNDHIRKLFGITGSHKLAFARGPVYLKPAEAGSATDHQLNLSEDSKDRSLECLVSLFLLGISVRYEVLVECLPDSVQLFLDLGLAFPCELDNETIVPYVHLFPLQVDDVCANDLIFATDLHPRVLSRTTVGTRHDGAVMYIGPDSLALLHHLPLSQHPGQRVLDLCTGSGIQALTALKLLGDESFRTLCVDINDRALRFVRFNAALNGLEKQVDVRQADLIAGTIRCETKAEPKSLLEGLQELAREMCHDQHLSESSRFEVILANPPFIPVPPDNDTVLQRYGLFSSGGPDGEDVLKAVVYLASELLTSNLGVLGIVSEFMNPSSPDDDQALLSRIQSWWYNGPGGLGILFTNELPVDAETYSTRRAGSKDEEAIWVRHLSEVQVTHVSPGLLFVFADPSMPTMSIVHRLVPKTDLGSLWTPSNRMAVEFTLEAIQKMLRTSTGSL